MKNKRGGNVDGPHGMHGHALLNSTSQQARLLVLKVWSVYGSDA